MRTMLPTAAALLLLLHWPAAAVELGPPAACELGRDCFVQQFADMDPGAGVQDPFCGGAAYDGHNAIDLRVLSMADVARGVPVLAMAEGTVLRLRDGMPDRMVVGEADRAAVADRQCGNGVVIAHADGFETQYCHLRQGSIAVAEGDAVGRGDPVGEIGASGMAQFPHVHVVVRRNGVELDPMTGRAVGEGCDAGAAAATLFSSGVAEAMGRGDSVLMAAGLAGGAVDHARLSVEGPPPAATARSEAIVAWGWAINLRQGDRFRFRITAPGGERLIDDVSDAADRHKASFSAFAGRRRPPAPGTYQVEVAILRGDSVVSERVETVTVE